MTISPCAILMTPITPKVIARPMAASSRTEPREIPYQAFCTASHNTRQFLIAAIAVDALLMTGAEVSAGRLESSPESFLVGALTKDVDGSELFFVARLAAG